MNTLYDVLDTISPRVSDAEYEHLCKCLASKYKRMERHLATIERREQWKNKPKSDSTITQEMIERAKAFPIERLISVQRGYALCLFHDDTRPSMLVKNNFAHCFSCGKTADTIDVYRKIHGCSFPDAVRNLT